MEHPMREVDVGPGGSAVVVNVREMSDDVQAFRRSASAHHVNGSIEKDTKRLCTLSLTKTTICLS
jgi:hypothetical protein